MGAGKTTIGREVAERTGRPFVDTDEEIERLHGPIPELFHAGEPHFRKLEEELVAELLAHRKPGVFALGGGAALSEATRGRLKRAAFTVWIEVAQETAWRRVEGSGRPLARSLPTFARLYEERRPFYGRAADAVADDVDDALLGSLHVSLTPGRLSKPIALGRRPIALVVDERAAHFHEPKIAGVASTHFVVGGEEIKTIAVAERLWHALDIHRDGSLVAFGGGCTTDLAGFVAATYMRGVPWQAIPTTLVGQVDAAIGGKTGIDLGEGKNLVGAFHFPQNVFLDPKLLATLPEAERRAGMAEVVKTGLLAGRDIWNLPEEEMIRACAAHKCGVVLSDPYETEGRRAVLNLGHTFAHALEAGSGYRVAHGEAVALGLLAALRLSGQPTDVVEEVLAPKPVHADRDAAWAALKRDKKGEGVFILLEAPGKPVVTTVPEAEARRALDELIAK